MTITLSGTFKKAMKRARARATATDGASSRGNVLVFPVRSGTGTLERPHVAVLQLTGTLRIKAGKRRVRFGRLEQLITEDNGRLTSAGKILFNASTAGRVATATDFTGLVVTGAPLRLNGAAARALNRKLRTNRFKKRMRVGRASAEARAPAPTPPTDPPPSDPPKRLERFATFQSGSYHRMQVNDQTAGMLAACGVTLSPIAPATPEPPGPGHAAPRLNFPVTGGTMHYESLVGEMNHDGGIRLQKTSTQSDFTQVILTNDANGARLSALESSTNGRMQFANVDLVAGTSERGGAPGQERLVIHNTPINFSDPMRSMLQDRFGCTVGAQPFATTIDAGGPVKIEER